jgi:tRNA(Phe) wybutosine-synthesizing methylase Tyw3
MITQYESESLGLMYGLIRQELLHVDTCTFNCAIRMIRSPMWAGFRNRISWR